MNSSVHAVCFDVGGVLIEIAYDWGETKDDPEFAEDPIHACEFFAEYQRGDFGEEEFIARLSLYLGVEAAEAARRHGRILKAPMPGVEALVKDLKTNGVLVGCLSNTNEPHWREMFDSGRFPAMEALEVRLASHRIGVSKPAQEAFLAFEKEARLAPGQIVLFDDTHANVVAAKEFGWHAQHIDPKADPAAQMRAWLTANGAL